MASAATTRRASFPRGAWICFLLVAGGLAPLVLSGERAKKETIKVGLLQSLTGILALPETLLKDGEVLAIEEINKAGGVLGKQIEAVVEDAESKFTTTYPEKAKKLLRQDKGAVLFGCWTSVSRKNVLPVVEQENGLLFYPMQYEGNECSKNVVYTGAVPNQQALPAVDWLMSKAGGQKKKFYLLGSDYVFPRVVSMILVKHLKSKGLDPAGVKFVPIGNRDFKDVVQDVKNAGPDAIVSTLIGDSIVAFHDELAAAGVTAKMVPVCALDVGEEELRGLDPKKVKDHLAARSYFQGIGTKANKEFVKKFKARYGKDRVTDSTIEAAYAAVHLWKNAVEKAKSTDVDQVRKAIRSGTIEFDAPGGKVKLDPKTQAATKPFYIGKIGPNRQFTIVYHAPLPLEPVPYPQVAFPGWGCDWTKGGFFRGKALDLR